MPSLITKPATAEAMRPAKTKLRESVWIEAKEFSKWGGFDLEYFFSSAVEYVLKHDSEWKKYKKEQHEKLREKS